MRPWIFLKECMCFFSHRVLMFAACSLLRLGSELLDADKNTRQTAYAYVSDMIRTTLCLTQTPEVRRHRAGNCR
jgi:hypothetical protein